MLNYLERNIGIFGHYWVGTTEPHFEFVPRSKRKRKRNQHPKSINISLNIGHPRLVFSQNT